MKMVFYMPSSLLSETLELTAFHWSVLQINPNLHIVHWWYHNGVVRPVKISENRDNSTYWALHT